MNFISHQKPSIVNSNEVVKENSYHYFFQDSAGQLLFLDSFNYHCMLAEYGEPSNFPDSIRGKILSIETVNQTEKNRKKVPFLKHLPLTTEIRLCDIDLSHILSQKTKSKFKVEFDRRKSILDRLEKKRRCEAHKKRLSEHQKQIQIKKLNSISNFHSKNPENPFVIAERQNISELKNGPTPAESFSRIERNNYSNVSVSPDISNINSVRTNNWSNIVNRGFAAVGDDDF